jgi:adenosylcobinamide-GDP ribazoletransferase
VTGPSGLPAALQFLTRVPLRLSAAAPHHRVVPWFPVVGVLIGAAVGGVAAALTEVVPVSVAASCAIVVGLLLTGAFHEDGLADVADAFGGGWTVERRLEILKDSRHGTYGVAALCSSIVIRVVALASIAAPAAMFASLVCAHALGRSAAVAAMSVGPAAGDSGLGVDAARSLRPVPVLAGLAGGIAVSTAAAGWWVGPFVIACAAAVVAVVALAVRKVGGLTGDVLGAVEQVAECLVLVVAAGLAEHHRVWWA